MPAHRRSESADAPTSPVVTFLLTDIEGSTRLWDHDPEGMGAAVARHDRLAESVIVAHHGVLVKSRGEGDSLFAVFAAAPEAVAAAAALQKLLLEQEWPTRAPLRVRAALHTGEADRREGDYYGAAVNRCARLRGTAHGGQVVLSLATEELVRARLPEGASLKYLGQHRLRDLARPEHVYQLLHPQLPADFPPLRSLNELPNNLPQQVTSFVGRERELDEVVELLAKTRLLTLTGAGGTGKTRLALQAAADLFDEYPDGAWLIELAALSDPALVPEAAASALGIKEEAGKPLTQTLLDVLKPKHLLLLLDNCEHLLPACATLADAILRSCPHVRILATSREGLNIPGELSYRVPSLSLPDAGKLPDFESLTRYEAVRLFIERAMFSQPAFRLTRENAPAVAEACCRLDGIPLAIELAAARVKAMPVEKINGRLSDRFRLLTGGSRTALPRQQTLRALIDWSYDLLSGSERLLLHRLAVFAGSWSLEAAESVCAADPLEQSEVLDLLTGLVAKSLVVYAEQDGRYRLLETMRQYAAERLGESGDAPAVRGRHRDWFTSYVARIGSLFEGAERDRGLKVVEDDYPNIRAALEWCLANEEGYDSALPLLHSLMAFWVFGFHTRDGRRLYEAFLTRARGAGMNRAIADLAAGAARLARREGDYAAARSLGEEVLSISRQLDDPEGVASALAAAGYLALYELDWTAARPRFEEALRIRRTLGDGLKVASSLADLGNMARFEANYEEARTHYEHALDIYRASVPVNRHAVAHALWNLGHVARLTRQPELAGSRYREAVELAVGISNRHAIAYCLEGCACLAADLRQAHRAAHLFGAAEALREAIQAPLPSVDRVGYEPSIHAARAALGTEAFAAAWVEGRGMTLEQAIACAQDAPAVGAGE